MQKKNSTYLTTVDNGEIKLTMYGTKEEPWFVANEVLDFLGVSINHRSRTLKRLDDDEKEIIRMMTPGGMQNIWMVSEPGFYRIALSARNEKAKQFQRIVIHDILPKIRKNGYYKVTAADLKREEREKVLKEINACLLTLDCGGLGNYEKIGSLDKLKYEKRKLQDICYQKEVEAIRKETMKRYPYTEDDLYNFGIDVGLAITNLNYIKEDLNQYMIDIPSKEIGDDYLYNDKFVKRCYEIGAVLDEERYQEFYLEQISITKS